MGRLTALQRLEANLRKIKADYDAVDHAKSWHERGAAYHSLVALIEFIQEMGWRDLDFALVELVVALTNIESGGTVDWLSNQVPNRAPTPIEISTLRGRKAACMEILMKQGAKREEAARRILRNLPSDSPALAGIRNPTWKTVARWRADVIGNVGPSTEHESYEAMLALAKRHRLRLSAEGPLFFGTQSF